MSNNDYLMHYGVKGQKWGIRRYQDVEGGLTAEGKRRLEQSRPKNTAALLSSKISTATKKVAISVKKGISNKVSDIARKHKPVSLMDNKELEDRLNRLKKEREYKQTLDDVTGRGERRKRKQARHDRFVNDMEKIFVNTAVDALKKQVQKQYNISLDKTISKAKQRSAEAEERRKKAQAEAIKKEEWDTYFSTLTKTRSSTAKRTAKYSPAKLDRSDIERNSNRIRPKPAFRERARLSFPLPKEAWDKPYGTLFKTRSSSSSKYSPARLNKNDIERHSVRIRKYPILR